MIKISGASFDQMMRQYKQLLDQTGLQREVKKRQFYIKPSQRRRDMRNKAIKRDAYRRKNGII